MPPQQKATCYWGLKFEDYVTSKGRQLYRVEYLILAVDYHHTRNNLLEVTKFPIECMFCPHRVMLSVFNHSRATSKDSPTEPHTASLSSR